MFFLCFISTGCGLFAEFFPSTINDRKKRFLTSTSKNMHPKRERREITVSLLNLLLLVLKHWYLAQYILINHAVLYLSYFISNIQLVIYENLVLVIHYRQWQTKKGTCFYRKARVLNFNQGNKKISYIALLKIETYQCRSK